MTVRTRVLVSIILAVILSIAGVTAMVSREMGKAFVANFKVSSEAQLERMNTFVENFFGTAVASAELLSQSPLLLENLSTITSYAHTTTAYKPIGKDLPPSERALYEEFLRVHKHFPAYSLVYAGNRAGGFTQAPDDTLTPGYNPSERGWYKEAAAAGKSIITEAYVSDSGEAVTTVATPVRRSGESGVAGVVGLDISLETLTKEIGSVTVGRTGYVFMMDATGLIICDPKNSGDNVAAAQRWLGKTVAPKPGVAEPLPVPGDALAALSSLRDKKQGVDEVGIGGKTWMAGVRTTQNGWTLVMLQEKDEIFADAMQVTLGILLVGLVIAVVMTIVAWLVARSIAGPITRLAGASQQVAEGDLQAIPEDGKAFRGELGILHKSLKLMVGKLVELIETANAKIREAEEALELSRSSLAQAEEAKRQAENARREGVLQTAGQIGAVIDQLAASAARLAEEALCTEQRAAEQTERVRGTIVAMEQMNAAVSNVAHSTSRTASLADESRTEAMSGRQLVMQVVSSMSEIEKQSLSMREGLEHLGGQASDIGKIMNVITDIADQTNLLALNAAIEAARAGEAGRGFAVVADEVRKLAEKTMEATRQVGEAISIIQSGTTTNINAMQEAASYIGKAAEVANNAGEALASIEQMVQNTAGEVRSIAIASEEQSATIEAINRSTEDIRRITDEVAAGAQRSNHAASELTQLSDRLHSVVQELRKG